MAAKERKKTVNLNVRRLNESVADFSYQIQIDMCQTKNICVCQPMIKISVNRYAIYFQLAYKYQLRRK